MKLAGKTATTHKLDTAEQMVRDGAKLLWSSADKNGPFWVFAAEDATTWALLNAMRATGAQDEAKRRIVGQPD